MSTAPRSPNPLALENLFPFPDCPYACSQGAVVVDESYGMVDREPCPKHGCQECGGVLGEAIPGVRMCDCECASVVLTPPRERLDLVAVAKSVLGVRS